MSYAMTLALQEALYQRLSTDADLGALVGGHVYDALPGGALPDLYVVLGAEKARDASDAGGAGAVHEFTVSVLTERDGFAAAKAAAAAISDALDAPLALSRGRVLGLRFHKAAAARVGSNERRRIDLTFHARLSDD
ncbi:DUF3168 domain-containing protein [Salipiger sp. IMCC34102]|uniref:DUF3168 domain-containing protein n=1 Tax=Salipiger sp. IMCC34102 TaxID=2510647 RepID=UPI00101D27F4|nr:DUF3168 domain-containing protein [Salipiger sp. IMCC34102]RYH03374.1 DUF3168 domain-containing protein [Salipiger sp. IMCC34102]